MIYLHKIAVSDLKASEQIFTRCIRSADPIILSFAVSFFLCLFYGATIPPATSEVKELQSKNCACCGVKQGEIPLFKNVEKKRNIENLCKKHARGIHDKERRRNKDILWCSCSIVMESIKTS